MRPGIPDVTRLLRRLPEAAMAALLGVFLQGSSCSGQLKGTEQGIYGTFLTYGPPHELADCTPFKTQFEIDECRRANERVIEEPYQAEIKIRNLETGEVRKLDLDAQGAYRANLAPGEYEVCVQGECSDPMTVRLNVFTTYGQRLPRAGRSGDNGPAAGAPSADTAKRDTASGPKP